MKTSMSWRDSTAFGGGGSLRQQQALRIDDYALHDFARLRDVVDQGHGTAIGTFEGEPLYHASLNGAEYRSLLAASGFGVIVNVASDPSCGGHTIWLAQLREPDPVSTQLGSC